MTQRVVAWMVGPPASVVHNSFLHGPSPYSGDVAKHMREGDVLIGKNIHGDVVVAERLLNGRLMPYLVGKGYITTGYHPYEHPAAQQRVAAHCHP